MEILSFCIHYIKEWFSPSVLLERNKKKTMTIEELQQRIFEVYIYRKKEKVKNKTKEWLMKKIGEIDIHDYDPNKLDDRIEELVDESLMSFELQLELDLIL